MHLESELIRMESKYSITMEFLFQELHISYKKTDDEATENTYMIMFPSKYVKQNMVMLELDDHNELSFYGTLPINIRPEHQTELLRAINQLNCEIPSFKAYIDEDDGSQELAFSRTHQLYGDTSKALVNAIALIQYLEKYMDMYVERVIMALKK